MSGFTYRMLATDPNVFVPRLTNLWDDLQLLALADVGRFGDGIFQLLDDLVIERLPKSNQYLYLLSLDVNIPQRSSQSTRPHPCKRS
jgi:hypothetical protein